MGYNASDVEDFKAFVAGGGMSKAELAEFETMLAYQPPPAVPRASLPPRPRTKKKPHHKYPSNYTPPKRK